MTLGAKNGRRETAMFVRAYLRASTAEQDATRAKADLERFAKEHGLKIAATYIEHESGAWKDRPELRRLLADCQPEDLILVEQVDRLSRLNADDWEALKAEIRDRKAKVVALDLPTSHQFAKVNNDDVTARMLEAVNNMMLDMLAAIARKDYEDRRRRQAQGIATAKAEGRYKGRPEDEERNEHIMQLLRDGWSWNKIQKHFATPMVRDGKPVIENGKRKMTTVSRSTLSRLKKRLDAEETQ